MKILEDRIIFGAEDWLDGLNPQSDSGALMVGPSLQIASAFDPFRPMGVAAPGLASTDTTNMSTVSGMVVSGIPKYATGGFTKGILLGNDGKIHELTFSNHTVTNSGGTFPYTISHGAHSSPVGEDFVAYLVGSTRYAFYSFRDATDWDIGRYDFVTTFDDDYMSIVPATPLGASYITDGKSSPHPMIVGADDVLYVGDRNFLHGFDGQVGANGTFSAAVLTLPAGYVITSFSKTDLGLVIYAYRSDGGGSAGSVSGTATAFFWDYLALDPYKVVDLDDNYVDGGFTWKGLPGCFTTGRPSDFSFGSSSTSKASDLRLWNGAQFESVASFDGTLPIYRGVDVFTEEIQWNSAGTVFSYSKRTGNYKLNKLRIAGSGSTSGFLKTMTVADQYISTGNGASGGLAYYISASGYTQGSLTTRYAKPNFPMGKKGRVRAIDIFLYNKGTVNNGQLTMNLNYFGGSQGQQTVFSSVDLFTKNANIYDEDVNAAPFSDFTHLGIEFGWGVGSVKSDTPKVIEVIVYFELINI